jgi:nicotinate-nucleotide adenylyltransferase
MTTSRRVGILGGTFDPVHCGHLEVGAAAQAALGLGEILLVPSNLPPHRPQPLASAYHRFAMVALAIAGRPGWRVLDLELREAAWSYTSETLERFHAEGFTATELFFIAGADAFLEIGTWHNYPTLLDFAHFAVVSRPGLPVAELPARLGALAGRMQTASVEAAAIKPASAEATGVRGSIKEGEVTRGSTMIFLIDAVITDVSSTEIRRRRAHDQSIAGMVAPAVQQHIEQHALYEDVTSVTRNGILVRDRRAGRWHGQD